MLRPRSLLLALGTWLTACSPAPSETALPAQVEPMRCVLPDADDNDLTPRTLALGEGAPQQFDAYRDGSEALLTLGWQGGYMITPRVRVEAHADEPSRYCWRVRLHNEAVVAKDSTGAADPNDELAPGLVTQLRFERFGDAFYSDPLNNLLAYDADTLLGEVLRLDFSVTGAGVDESASVSVVLAGTPDAPP